MSSHGSWPTVTVMYLKWSTNRFSAISRFMSGLSSTSRAGSSTLARPMSSANDAILSSCSSVLGVGTSPSAVFCSGVCPDGRRIARIAQVRISIHREGRFADPKDEPVFGAKRVAHQAVFVQQHVILDQGMDDGGREAAVQFLPGRQQQPFRFMRFKIVVQVRPVEVGGGDRRIGERGTA